MKTRRRFENERENHDRWLVSYADFITLLFAFFVVMYAVSSVNQGKYKVLTNSLGSAFGNNINQNLQQAATLGGQQQLGGLKQNQRAGYGFIKPFPAIRRRNEKLEHEHETMTAMAVNLSQILAPMVKEGKMQVIQNNRGIRIDISSNLLFLSGSAELDPASIEPLYEIVSILKDGQNPIQIEGHTDSDPIHNYLFFSNWELSAVRATTVVRLLADAGISESRLSAVGYGSAQPLGPNDTSQNRAKNRRVSIMVLYGEPEKANDGAVIAPSSP